MLRTFLEVDIPLPPTSDTSVVTMCNAACGSHEHSHTVVLQASIFTYGFACLAPHPRLWTYLF